MGKLRVAGASIVLLTGLLIVVPVQAATITAGSSSRAHVQAAIDAAASGDTVAVPPGTSVWSTGVSIPNSKKLTLRGAGIDNTIITVNPTGNAVNLGQSGSRLTGFRFNNGTVEVDGDGWRVDNCMFQGIGDNLEGVVARGERETRHPQGLVDHCVFHNKRVLVIGWAGLLAHALWAQPLGLGTGDNAVYVEDCTFTADSAVFCNAIDSNYGGSFVFRHNDVTDMFISNHSVQGNHRASRKQEIYGNTINRVSGSMWVPIMLRGGTGVVFDNTVTGLWGNPNIALDNVRSCEDRGTPPGIADGTSPWDGNELANGYPARDQIGRGTDQWLWTPANPYPPQSREPMYGWNNKNGSSDVLFFQHNCSASADHIQPNRDYYNNVQKPGYTPYTYPHPLIQEWDGASGTGGTSSPSAPTGLRIQN